MITPRQKALTAQVMQALAVQVILPMAPLPETAGHCPAWIESKGAECRRPATDGLLCRRHHHVAERRLTAAIEKRQAEAVKAVEKAPARRARLAAVEERIARLEGRLSRPDTTDTAAYGGAVNTRIQARREAAMVRDVETGAELHRLTREAESLRSLLAVTA
ncbi:hypothetical protein [Micrococcus luteus]|uniref:hypothetical protein n=1 Tax=Micrococcus luteus TaxID=1270 RepID=UPI0023025327|nr:hypothetical protein [Micrococcus luteus]